MNALRPTAVAARGLRFLTERSDFAAQLRLALETACPGSNPPCAARWLKVARTVAVLGCGGAARRGRIQVAADSLHRGWERIGVPPAPDGSWADRIAYLARQCAAQEPRLTGFADDIERLARELLSAESS